MFLVFDKDNKNLPSVLSVFLFILVARMHLYQLIYASFRSLFSSIFSHFLKKTISEKELGEETFSYLYYEYTTSYLNIFSSYNWLVLRILALGTVPSVTCQGDCFWISVAAQYIFCFRYVLFLTKLYLSYCWTQFVYNSLLPKLYTYINYPLSINTHKNIDFHLYILYFYEPEFCKPKSHEVYPGSMALTVVYELIVNQK